jgi:hypothetical protein
MTSSGLWSVFTRTRPIYIYIVLIVHRNGLFQASPSLSERKLSPSESSIGMTNVLVGLLALGLLQFQDVFLAIVIGRVGQNTSSKYKLQTTNY